MTDGVVNNMVSNRPRRVIGVASLVCLYAAGCYILGLGWTPACLVLPVIVLAFHAAVRVVVKRWTRSRYERTLFGICAVFCFAATVILLLLHFSPSFVDIRVKSRARTELNSLFAADARFNAVTAELYDRHWLSLTGKLKSQEDFDGLKRVIRSKKVSLICVVDVEIQGQPIRMEWPYYDYAE